jgi:AcrR family transcriptional regulator
MGERAHPVEIGAQDSLKRRQVADVQRARILAAMVDVCRERGAGDVAVAHVVARAGVSRRTFYELFEDCESALMSALEEAVARASARVGAVYDANQPWRERIRTSLVALLGFFEDEPTTAHLLVVGSHAAGREADQLRVRIFDQIVAAIDGARGETKSASGLSPLTAEGIVGAVLFVIHRRVTEADAEAEANTKADSGAHARALMELVNPLMSLIVLPYFGGAAARAESKRPAVVPQPARQPSGSLSGLDIRLTYRTMRVLSAIATRPGSSNRDVGRAADAADPGQISKLLTRLQRLGLIENRQAGGPKGMPNAWALTLKGAEVERAIAAHSGSLAR